MKFIILPILALLVLSFMLTACNQSDADVAAHNISKAAEHSTSHYRVIFKPETIIPDIDRP